MGSPALQALCWHCGGVEGNHNTVLWQGKKGMGPQMMFYLTTEDCHKAIFKDKAHWTTTWVGCKELRGVKGKCVDVWICFVFGVRAPLRDSLVAQSVKNLPAMQETRVWFLDVKDPLEKEMATHPSILAWRILWTEEPVRLQSMGS